MRIWHPIHYLKQFISNSKVVTEEGQYALDAVQNNPDVTGSLRNEIKFLQDLDTKTYLYRNRRKIPFTPEELDLKKSQGDFTGLNIGDYVEMTLEGELAGTVVQFDLVGMDIYRGYSSNYAHTLDFVIHDALMKRRMNATNNNIGGFQAMELYTYLQTTIWNCIPERWRNVIKPKGVLLENKAAAISTSWDWKFLNLWLLADIELFGYSSWAQQGFGQGNFKQYPFFMSENHLIKGYNGSTIWYWLLQPATYGDGTTRWCCCYSNGFSNYYSMGSADGGVVFGFRI